MKKLLITFGLILISLLGYSQKLGISLSGGYSWVNGVIGTEVHFAHLGVSAGWFPTSMPLSGDKVSSYSGALTWYGNQFEKSCMYGSIGIANAGYRYEDTNGTSIISPMTIAMLGYRYTGDNGLYTKLGAGYGWADLGSTWTFECIVGYTIEFF